MSDIVARKLLANMPDEVFGIYIEPLIASYGWPFETVDSSTDGTYWQLAFDHYSLKTISELSWKHLEIPFSLRLFHPFSQERIIGIYDTHIRGMNTPFTNIKNGAERFFRIRSYIASTGRMPVPVILMHDIGGLHILDGNHRLAAMASFTNSSEAIVDCWIGRLIKR